MSQLNQKKNLLLLLILYIFVCFRPYAYIISMYTYFLGLYPSVLLSNFLCVLFPMHLSTDITTSWKKTKRAMKNAHMKSLLVNWQPFLPLRNKILKLVLK